MEFSDRQVFWDDVEFGKWMLGKMEENGVDVFDIAKKDMFFECFTPGEILNIAYAKGLSMDVRAVDVMRICSKLGCDPLEGFAVGCGIGSWKEDGDGE